MNGGKMFRGLRAKLVVSHFIVILTALVLTAAIASVPIRRVQEARMRANLTASSEAVARQLTLARAANGDAALTTDTTQRDFAQRLVTAEQQRSGNRILVLDQAGSVLLDSAPGAALVGQTPPEFGRAISRVDAQVGIRPAPARVVGRLALSLETYATPADPIEGRGTVIAASAANGVPGQTPLYVAALAPQRSTPLLDEFVRPLAVASMIALGISVLVALFIARAIAAPLRRVTNTVSRIAAHDLDTRISSEGSDEVGALVHAFNNMLDRLAGTYRSQRDLLANIAHELRTPLTSIQGYAQGLRDGVIADEAGQVEALDVISDEARRMATLVEQILQLARLESGQLPLTITAVEASDLLVSVAREFRPVALERDVELTATASEVTLRTDHELLRQALGNLTSNALRHTAPGGHVGLQATAVTDAGRGPLVRLAVTDDGAGMAPEDLQRIFERFYRASEREAGPPSKNYGLGLAIVQEIVNRLSGTISVESRVNAGTTFTIELPLRLDDSA